VRRLAVGGMSEVFEAEIVGGSSRLALPRRGVDWVSRRPEDEGETSRVLVLGELEQDPGASPAGSESRVTRSESGAEARESGVARSESGAAGSESKVARSESGVARRESGVARRESGPEARESRSAGSAAERVVIKVMLPHLAKDEDARAAFAHEAELGYRLNDDHLVRVLDDGDDRGAPFVVLERVDGATLLDILSDSRLPLSAVLVVAADLLSGLSHLHAATDEAGNPLGIVHRDVSPDNALVDRAGLVKLADLGIARSRLRGQRTRTGIVRGKAAYLSPEQVTGSDVDGRADLYALGAVLFEAATGARYTPGDTDIAILRNAENPRFVAPSTKGADPRLDSLLRRALGPFPEDRYPSAAAMRREVLSLLDSLGPGALTEGRRALSEAVELAAPRSEQIVSQIDATAPVARRPPERTGARGESESSRAAVGVLGGTGARGESESLRAAVGALERAEALGESESAGVAVRASGRAGVAPGEPESTRVAPGASNKKPPRRPYLLLTGVAMLAVALWLGRRLWSRDTHVPPSGADSNPLLSAERASTSPLPSDSALPGSPVLNAPVPPVPDSSVPGSSVSGSSVPGSSVSGSTLSNAPPGTPVFPGAVSAAPSSNDPSNPAPPSARSAPGALPSDSTSRATTPGAASSTSPPSGLAPATPGLAAPSSPTPSTPSPSDKREAVQRRIAAVSAALRDAKARGRDVSALEDRAAVALQAFLDGRYDDTTRELDAISSRIPK